MLLWHISTSIEKCPSCHDGRMDIPKEYIERFREDMRNHHGAALSYEQAKMRYRELLNLFWILSHRPPAEGEPPYEPPPPPWQ